MGKNTPAFPVSGTKREMDYNSSSVMDKPYIQTGMTLRQYYAGQALHGLCANQSYVAAIATDEELNDEDKPFKLAEICFELADAMIAESEK